LTRTAVAMSLWLISAAPSVNAAAPSEVQIEQGRIQGVAATDPTITVFKGIPYAAPPTGERRWRAPEPSRHWSGLRRASEFAAACPQRIPGPRLPWTAEFSHRGAVAEDCLYLNIWTAKPHSGVTLPVLVFIPGGGFLTGSGSIDVYNGESLAAKGLVVVTINYRLGMLGYLAHPELSAESEHHVSGNYGLLDQLAALRWVQRNIAAFGGDPHRVTVEGQSAGATSIQLLMPSKLTKGLFQRAIIESGLDAGTIPGTPPEHPVMLVDAERAGAQFAEANHVASIAALRRLSVDEVLALNSPPSAIPWRPIVDGYVVPQQFVTTNALGAENDVPTIVGTNADEGSAAPGYGRATIGEFDRQTREVFGNRADDFLRLYPARSDQEAAALQRTSRRELSWAALDRNAAQRAKNSKQALYIFYFARAMPWPEHPEYGAFHSSELPYVFDNLRLSPHPFTSTDQSTARVMSSYWVNFVRSGDPNGPDLPVWPIYRDLHDFLVVSDEGIGAKTLIDQKKLAALQDFLNR
jgi:para-nitrobenzyl esterase